MVYKEKIGNSEFIIHIFKNGGKTNVYKNKKVLFSGQYFPDRKKLIAFNYNFEEIIISIEKSINSNINPDDIIFPFYD